ncbi:hypothetical protein LX32DRAFT_730203 [Colletotrichum zoysiae]|uniref:Uncharacterized protein n=1 Tax=Colletotrichum zoysiae TaxID=1216348 RepID=A0AAD9HEC4_9PEZI|nr:hypothetical protein LX32DRAFT_730203 [Colletotrichum zoysiae]
MDESVIVSNPPYSGLVDPSFLHTFNLYMVTDNEECCAKTASVPFAPGAKRKDVASPETDEANRSKHKQSPAYAGCRGNKAEPRYAGVQAQGQERSSLISGDQRDAQSLNRCDENKMVAFRFLLALLPLAAAMPSSDALGGNTLVRRHCMAPKNCGAVVQNTACDYCCAKDVKPDSSECKAKDNKACQTSDKKDGIQFSCDAD